MPYNTKAGIKIIFKGVPFLLLHNNYISRPALKFYSSLERRTYIVTAESTLQTATLRLIKKNEGALGPVLFFKARRNFTGFMKIV